MPWRTSRDRVAPKAVEKRNAPMSLVIAAFSLLQTLTLINA